MAEKVPAGTAPSGGAFVVNSPDAHPRPNDIIMHNIAIQPGPVEATPSISHPHSSNAYVRPSGVQQACVSKPANKVSKKEARQKTRQLETYIQILSFT